ncbi:hypothetical protein Sjap_011544 [Stephania japonica]|uniref:BRISC and BRCA1-A complex member 1 n=1 Tax=Stephania japonica TaxID=461633 RepID=A0AAP0JDP7_9MAGN
MLFQCDIPIHITHTVLYSSNPLQFSNPPLEATMEIAEGESSSRPPYTLLPIRLCSEDILFCVDVDLESQIEMKISGPNGRPITRLDSIKQAILLFVHAKLAINPDHRFSIASLGQSASWKPTHFHYDIDDYEQKTRGEHRKEFSSEVESAIQGLRVLSASSSHGQADLTQLFRIAAHEAKKSRQQNRILRVHQWPASQKLFTVDVIYLHDKPSPDNCPQEVYDTLVDALEHVSEYEGYIFESGQGLSRTLFRQICVLLSHPQQRCGQDGIDIPKSLVRKAESAPGEENIPPSSQ